MGKSKIGGKFQDNWIVLDLENIGSTESMVTLFNPNIDYNGTTRQRAGAGTITFSAGQWIIRASKNGGAPLNYFFENITSIIQLVDEINDVFTVGALGVFEYELSTPTKFFLDAYVSTNLWDFVSANPPSTPSQNFVDSSTDAVRGSSVKVTSESGIPMNEITQEVAFQPYILDTVNVYADTMAQANNDVKVLKRWSNGQEYKRFEYPTVNPMQPQFALEDVKIDFPPSPTNYLGYNVDGGESVRMIFKYSFISNKIVSEIKTPELFVPPEAIILKPNIYKPISLLTGLVGRYANQQSESIKHLVNRKIGDS